MIQPRSKRKNIVVASQLLDPDPFHTPSGWRDCLLSELATGSLYVVESFNGGSLSDFRAAVNSPDVIYI